MKGNIRIGREDVSNITQIISVIVDSINSDLSCYPSVLCQVGCNNETS